MNSCFLQKILIFQVVIVQSGTINLSTMKNYSFQYIEEGIFSQEMRTKLNKMTESVINPTEEALKNYSFL